MMARAEVEAVHRQRGAPGVVAAHLVAERDARARGAAADPGAVELGTAVEPDLDGERLVIGRAQRDPVGPRVA